MESRAHIHRSTTADPPVADTDMTQIHPTLSAAIGQQCPACGTALAPDQRYCLECGERCGAPRLKSISQPAQAGRDTQIAERPPRRLRMSANSTLIAGIGTLLLALGIGVLIGRSGNSTNSKASPAVQVVTVPGAASTAGTTAASATTQGASTSATSKAKKSGGAATTSTSKPKSSAPAPKVVKVGSPGHGPGYQNGHFTGNFFGP
jgi:hypothetical protein